MTLLRREQISKDLALIRIIKKDVIWFLQIGPKGTPEFFEDHKKKNYNKQNLKLKIKSLKIYFDVLQAIVAEDCADAKFIQNVFFVCQSAILGSKHLDGTQESYIPPIVKNTWVYIIMWHAKDLVIRNKDQRELKNAIRALESKFLKILDKICDYRLNYQIQKVLINFKSFEDQNWNPHVATQDFGDLDMQFQELFSYFQLSTDFKLSDITIYQRVRRDAKDRPEELERWKLPLSKDITKPMDYDQVDNQLVLNKKVPFDLFLMNYIFQSDSNNDVRVNALKVLLKNFTQRDLVVKELARTDIIVSGQDFTIYLNFVQKQRKLKECIHQMIQDEMFHMLFNRQPSMATKQAKDDVMEILQYFMDQLTKAANDVELRKVQNILRHLNVIDDLVNVMLKRLIYKEFYYNDMFQKTVDLLFMICLTNPCIQRALMADINFFLDMMNIRVDTGKLISEIIKGNTDEEFIKKFILYLTNLIFEEGYFKSSLINQLIKLATGTGNGEREHFYGSPDGGEIDDQRPESPNQQFIFKQCINQPKFRQILMMKKAFTYRKLGVIKTYAKKLEQYILAKKSVDSDLLKDKEQLDLHIAVVKLVTACARNSHFGIAQAQKLIECEELLDTMLSDSIPYLLKKHYADLLYEVYLRKVPGLEEQNRLSIADIKFIQIMKWVVLYDFMHCFNYYVGFVVDAYPQEPPEHVRKRKQVIREIERASENEYDEMYAGKTEKDIDDERRFKAALSQFKDSSPFYVFDPNDKTEFWRYIYEYHKSDRATDGILSFIVKFYRDYPVHEMKDENLQDVSVKLRDRLLAISNSLYKFIENHEEFIKPDIYMIHRQINNAMMRVPGIHAFRVGAKKVVKKNEEVSEEEEDAEESLNQDESRDQDHKMCAERVMRILRDYIIKENQTIRQCFDVTHVSSDFFIDKDDLKDKIKRIAKQGATFDEIVKAITHFHKVSFEKKQERQVMNVEPGQLGYVMERNEGASNLKKEILGNKINFKDFEQIIKDQLDMQGFKQPYINREKDMEDPHSELKQTLSDKDLSMAINVDLKLFTQRYFEFVHQTQNVSEIHDFVNKLMSSEFIDGHDAKVQLVRNLCSCFKELHGIEDELALISILSIILMRTMPEDEDNVRFLSSEIKKQQFRKVNKKKYDGLKEWQKVLFDASVPEMMFEFIDIHQDQYLSSKAMGLVNLMIARPTEQQQHVILNILRKNDDFFRVFFYIQSRMQISKKFLIEKIKHNARHKFIDKRMKDYNKDALHLQNDLKIQNVYMSQKYEIEQKYDDLKAIWRQDEITTLLGFMNYLCEGCNPESQNYLRDQFQGMPMKLGDIKQGKITSIDLIFEVVTIFIDIADELGTYIYSDFRTYKLVPLLLDTIIEFIYGPNIENQIFLGKWKKFIIILNKLMSFKERGNYSGIHQEAKAQFKILNSCSNTLLAIVDIKDPEKAKEIHNIILEEIDVENLREKMVEIYLYKIGGSAEKKRIYDFDIVCNHVGKLVKDEQEHCIENEFCQHGFLIPRDKETIQTGFNIFKILQILKNSHPEHEKIQCLEIDKAKKDYLWKDYGKYYSTITKNIVDSYSAKSTMQIFFGFNLAERKILDNLIIKCFPKTYMEYLESITPQEDDIANLLNQILYDKDEAKSLTDLQKILEKVQSKIQDDINKEIEKKELGDNQLLIDLEMHNMEEDFYNNDDDQQKLISAVVNKEPLVSKNSVGLISYVKQIFQTYKQNKIQVGDGYSDLPKSEKRDRTMSDRQEYQEKLSSFKFYLAHQFYQDNLGKVEILQADENIIETTFKMPAYTHLLPIESRKQIPSTIFGVSQQEKLETFMGTITLLRTEMIWQQELGRFSSTMKFFANNHENISMFNFIIIVATNFFFVLYLQIDDLNTIAYSNPLQRSLVTMVSMFQTFLACVVVLAYYVQNRAKLLVLISREEAKPGLNLLKIIFKPRKTIQQNWTKLKVKLQGTKGMNKGSQGFGQIKCTKADTSVSNSNVFLSGLDKIQQIKSIGIFMQIVRELKKILKCLFVDRRHLMNTIYVLISVASLRDDFYNALLLADILNKIPQLRNVYEIFSEQAYSLGSTMLLFVVVLYIYAFIAFQQFPGDFEAIVQPADSWHNDKHAPDFFMYCETLSQCVLSVMNAGIRAGGGLGEAITQRAIEDELFMTRYIYDLSFFLIVNIILLNIFFGIIIDSFADKRALNNQQDSEIENQCFICGITKSRFDIEHVVWKEHIYCQHNMHSYLAFILYVIDKPVLECTGVEKYVKQKIKDGVIEYYPVNRCLAIKDGEIVEE